MYFGIGALGLILSLAPFLLGYADSPAALWSSIIIGGVVLVISTFEYLARGKDSWEYWSDWTLGVLAVLSPFLLQFHTQEIATWTSILLGTAIAFLASFQLPTE